ncbi:hypothetical protein D3C77_268430 [compost metagenome]
MKQYSHGIYLFSRGAAGMPNTNIGIGSKHRDYLFPKYPKQVRITEHFRHGDRQIVDKAFKAIPVMKNFLLQPGYRLQLLGMDMMPYSSAQGGNGIISEIVSVKPMNPLQQQLNLNILPLAFAGIVRHILF